MRSFGVCWARNRDSKAVLEEMPMNPLFRKDKVLCGVFKIGSNNRIFREVKR